MKNLTLLLLLSFVTVFGQKKLMLTHQVDYALVEKKSYSEKIDTIFLSSYYNDKSDVLAINLDAGFLAMTSLIYNGNTYKTSMTLNQIKLENPKYSTKATNINDFITDIQPKDKTDKINGKKCHYYAAKIKEDLVELCMAKNHKINSFASFNNELSDKGFLLKMKVMKKDVSLIYLNEKEIHLPVDFDVKKEIAAYHSKIEALKKEEEDKIDRIEEPVEVALVEDEGEWVEVEEIVEPLEEYPDVPMVQENHVPGYDSYYKQRTLDESNLAINNLNKNNIYWKAIPRYCKKLDTILPNLNDETYQKELKNYAGQVCDLYLKKSYDIVSFKGTLDEIRRSVLYMQTHFNTLKKSDQKEVIKFLDELD